MASRRSPFLIGVIVNKRNLHLYLTPFILSALFATRTVWAEVVKIGNAAPTTGSIAHIGKDMENGALLAVEEINREGLTIDGKKIELELDKQDDQADPKTATQVAQHLVDDKVVAVVGHGNSGASIPASKIYHDAGIVQISPGSTNPAYTLQGFKTTYRVLATDAQLGPALAKYAYGTRKLRTVAVVDDATAYGQGLADVFRQRATSLGMNVLSVDETNDKAVDFRAILTRIKSERPNSIFYGGMDSTAGPFSKQARQLGIDVPIFSGDGACTDNLSDLAGVAAENVVCAEAGRDIQAMPGGKDFKDKYQKRFGQPVEVYAPFAYDAVHVIVAAMQRANSVDPAKILDAMPKTDYAGVTGHIAFDGHGDLQHGVVSLYIYKNGKRTLLQVVEM
jgi:branched-chain amino acid transport system substrate-binding protein